MKIFVVDDHPVVRQGIRQILAGPLGRYRAQVCLEVAARRWGLHT